MDVLLTGAEQERYLAGCSRERIQRICTRTARMLGVDAEDMDLVEAEVADAAWDEVVGRMWLEDELRSLADRGVLAVDGVDEAGRLRYRLHPDLAA